MSVTSTILFDLPQREIASLIENRIARSRATSIVTGFATPGGIAAIDASIKAQPNRLATLVVGAATYPAFEALDHLLATGVASDRLYVHLGHTKPTGGKRNPFARYTTPCCIAKFITWNSPMHMPARSWGRTI